MLLLCSASFVYADIQGACAVGHCTCDGTNFFTCPCNANPCTVCKPGDLVYRESGCDAGLFPSGSSASSEPNTNNPQTAGDMFATMMKGLGIMIGDFASGVQNMFGHSHSAPSQAASGTKKTLPYGVSPAPTPQPCGTGQVMAQDGTCHEECGTSKASCEEGSQCVDGQCACDPGYYVGSDGLCHQECGNSGGYCPNGTVCGGDTCIKCNPGFIAAEDGCHEECGTSGTYCAGNSLCVNGQCQQCDSGYILGTDNLCHEECGNTGTYCAEGALCINGQCTGCAYAPCAACNPSNVLGQDGLCHPKCGTTGTYCAGISRCINAKCVLPANPANASASQPPASAQQGPAPYNFTFYLYKEPTYHQFCDKIDPYDLNVRESASAAIRKDAGPYSTAQLFDIYDWVRQNIVYQNGPLAGIPYPPSQTLATGSGDCKNQAVLIASMVKSIGGTAAVVADPTCAHAYAIVRFGPVGSDTNWIIQAVAAHYGQGVYVNWLTLNGYIWVIFDPAGGKYPGQTLPACLGNEDHYIITSCLDCANQNPGAPYTYQERCYSQCPSGTISTNPHACMACPQGSTVLNNKCLSCPGGYVLGQDAMCHPQCGGANQYCATGTCQNGRCYNQG